MIHLMLLDTVTRNNLGTVPTARGWVIFFRHESLWCVFNALSKDAMNERHGGNLRLANEKGGI